MNLFISKFKYIKYTAKISLEFSFSQNYFLSIKSIKSFHRPVDWLIFVILNRLIHSTVQLIDWFFAI